MRYQGCPERRTKTETAKHPLVFPVFINGADIFPIDKAEFQKRNDPCGDMYIGLKENGIDNACVYNARGT